MGDTPGNAVQPIKPGVTTSEFKVLVIVQVLAAILVAVGHASGNPIVEGVTAAVAAALSGATANNYVTQRTELKAQTLPPFLSGNPPADE